MATRRWRLRAADVYASPTPAKSMPAANAQGKMGDAVDAWSSAAEVGASATSSTEVATEVVRGVGAGAVGGAAVVGGVGAATVD